MHKLGSRGFIDGILRLFEQGEITRAKARETVEWLMCPVGKDPDLPWDRLDWGGAEPMLPEDER